MSATSSPYPASGGGDGVRVEWHEGAIAALTTAPDGPVAAWLRKAGERVEARMVELAPRDTGQLAESIASGVVLDDGALEAQIGPAQDRNARPGDPSRTVPRVNEDVARWNELGTSNRRARPFMRVALSAAEER